MKFGLCVRGSQPRLSKGRINCGTLRGTHPRKARVLRSAGLETCVIGPVAPPAGNLRLWSRAEDTGGSTEMRWINFCRWLTLERTRYSYGWRFPERLKEPAAQEEMSAWSLGDYEGLVGEWATIWLMVGGIAVVPGYWIILQWAPSSRRHSGS